mmetsp:Transcript_22310/g.88563  ORF Transcript_22310/g.88563 Transcript_22310/m.88563 type:complete len:238 (+) Transcript_22310:67-780(+)
MRSSLLGLLYTPSAAGERSSHDLSGGPGIQTPGGEEDSQLTEVFSYSIRRERALADTGLIDRPIDRGCEDAWRNARPPPKQGTGSAPLRVLQHHHHRLPMRPRNGRSSCCPCAKWQSSPYGQRPPFMWCLQSEILKYSFGGGRRSSPGPPGPPKPPGPRWCSGRPPYGPGPARSPGGPPPGPPPPSTGPPPDEPPGGPNLRVCAMPSEKSAILGRLSAGCLTWRYLHDRPWMQKPCW